MAKNSGATAALNTGAMEGHGGDEHQPGIGKGTFMPVGTAVPLASEAISVNKKSGKATNEQP